MAETGTRTQLINLEGLNTFLNESKKIFEPTLPAGTDGQVLKLSGGKPKWGTDNTPTAFKWTGGTTAGPTGSLTGNGMSAVAFPAVPSASASASGVVTTGTQTFAGVKTFSSPITGSLNGNASTATSADKTAHSLSVKDGAATPAVAINSWNGSTDKTLTIKGESPVTTTAADGTITITHATSGATAGTYKSVTVDAKGHVTGGTNPSTLSGYGITDAKIASGVITLGSNTITPLTSSSTLAASKVNGTLATSNIPNLDASKITSGTISVDRLPATALERCVVVADDTARFALKTSSVQVGDTVKVTATKKMYMVIDSSKLSSEAGYEEYFTSTDWSTITNKPGSFTPSSHPHGNITNAGAIGNAADKLVATAANGVLTASTTLAATSLAAGSTPTVSLSSGTLTFGIPKGDKGATGATGSKGVSISKVEQTTTSTADAGTNVITVTLSNGNTSTFNVKNGSKGSTGSTGAAAGFGTPTASVDANVGTPSVTVTASGADTAKVFNFAFKNLKGATGATGPRGPAGPNFSLTEDSTSKLYFIGAADKGGNINTSKTSSAYMQAGKVYCAVWNDLADSISVDADCDLDYGYCYCFDGKKYIKSSKYLSEGIIGVHSDTYGLKIGSEDGKRKMDVAVAGFVLAYVDKEYKPGTPLTCTKNGYLTKIKLKDKIRYPERIIATYWKNEPAEEWGSDDRKVKVNGRKWVKVV